MALASQPMTLTLPSDLRLLGVARDFVEAVCQTGGLDQSTTDAVILATNEAASNIIRHAHRGRPDAHFEIECRFLPEGLEIRMLDDGDPFDLTAVPELDPAEIRLGGRGVFLMRSLMDEVSSQPREGGGNALRMFKRCGRNSPKASCG